MPISTAVQQGSYVYAFNERNIRIFSQTGTLHGYTATTVSLRRGNYIYTFNEKGVQISSHPVK